MLHDSIKHSSEETVARPFMAYLSRLGIETVSWRRGDPTQGEPDVVCTGGRERLFGIEIASAFYSPGDARQLRTVVTELAREGKRRSVMSKSDIDDADLPPGPIRNPDAKLAANLQAAMVQHCLKRYGMRTYLLLDGSWAPLTSADDAGMILASLSKPPTCGYADVFVALTRNWSSERVFFRLEP